MRGFLKVAFWIGLFLTALGLISLSDIGSEVSRQPAIVIVPQMILATMLVSMGVLTSAVSAAGLIIVTQLEVNGGRLERIARQAEIPSKPQLSSGEAVPPNPPRPIGNGQRNAEKSIPEYQSPARSTATEDAKSLPEAIPIIKNNNIDPSSGKIVNLLQIYSGPITAMNEFLKITYEDGSVELRKGDVRRVFSLEKYLSYAEQKAIDDQARS